MTAWIIAAVCAFFVKGVCGFANTLVFSTVLSFSVSNVNISPVELLLGLPANVIIAVKERRAIKWKMCFVLVALIIVGSIPGMLLLKTADAGMIKVLFGAVIVLIGLEMMISMRSGKPKTDSKIVLAAISVLSGLLCGLYGIGALMGAYVSRISRDSHEFKANMCTIFAAENLFRMVMYMFLGIITGETALLAAKLMPFVLLGLGLGMAAGRRLQERTARRIVIVMLILSGAVLMVSNV